MKRTHQPKPAPSPTTTYGWFLAAVINDACGNCGMPLDKGHTCTPGDGAR